MATLQEIRQQYPQYKDMPDEVLADKLYQKFYKDIPREQFNAQMGIDAPAPGVPPEPRNVMPSQEPGSIFEPIMQGVTAGSFDELVGGIGGIHSLMKGEPFSKGYNLGTETTRGRGESFAAAHPVASAAGEAGGALLTLPATGGVNAFKTGTALGRGANAALTGGAYSGVYGFNTGEGGFIPRAENAAKQGAIGLGIGAATPLATGAVGWIAQKAFGQPLGFVDNWLRPVRRAKSAVNEAIAKDARSAGISPEQALRNVEQAQRAGVPMKMLDVGTATARLGRTAKNISPEAEATLDQTVNQRFATQADRVIETIRSVAPGVNAPGAKRLNEASAKLTNDKNYTKAKIEGAYRIWDDEFEQLTVSPDIQAAIKDAARIGQNDAAVRGTRPPRPPFEFHPDGSMTPVPGMPTTLEFWDQVKRSLDGQIGIQKRAGNKEYAGQLTELKGKLVEKLDAAVPSYKVARQGAYGYFNAEDAIEAGSNFARMGRGAFKEDEVVQALGKMTPAERSLFGEGYATELINVLENVPDRASVINRIFNSPANKRQFEIALGPQAFEKMETTLRLEDMMQKSRQIVQGNSTTALQQIAAQTFLGGAAGTYFSGGDWSSPSAWFTALLTMGMSRAARGKIGQANEKMAREVGELLASGDPKLVQQAITQLSRAPHGMDILRRAHTWVTRMSIPALARTNGGVNQAPPDGGTGVEPLQ